MVTPRWRVVVLLVGTVVACGKTADDLAASNSDGNADGAAGASGSGGALPADAGPAGAGGEGPRDAATGGGGGATVYEICDSSECLCRAAQTCTPAQFERNITRGTVGRRICGTLDGKCVLTSYARMGAASVTRCELAPPVTCDGISTIPTTNCSTNLCRDEVCNADPLSCARE